MKLGFPLHVEVQPNENSTTMPNPRFMANTVAIARGVAGESPSGRAEPAIAPGEITLRALVKIEFELLKP